jgi:hypothetical protein
MNIIFNDNVRILCLSCNVKKVGKLVRFRQKGQKQGSFLAFHKCCQGDPDGDTLKCRWAVGKECDSICNGVPVAKLDEVNKKHNYQGYKSITVEQTK